MFKFNTNAASKIILSNAIQTLLPAGALELSDEQVKQISGGLPIGGEFAPGHVTSKQSPTVTPFTPVIHTRE